MTGKRRPEFDFAIESLRTFKTEFVGKITLLSIFAFRSSGAALDGLELLVFPDCVQ